MRTRDIAAINALANQPGVPELFGVEAFDFTDAVNDERNVFLAHRGCLLLCEWSGPRIYQLHLASPKGYSAVKATAEMVEHARGFSDVLWAQIPLDNVGTRKLAGFLGFDRLGFGHNPFLGQEVEYFRCPSL